MQNNFFSSMEYIYKNSEYDASSYFMTRDHTNGTVCKEKARPTHDWKCEYFVAHTYSVISYSWPNHERAPEEIRNSVYPQEKLHHNKADVWIVGCVLCLDQTMDGTLWGWLPFNQKTSCWMEDILSFQWNLCRVNMKKSKPPWFMPFKWHGWQIQRNADAPWDKLNC